MGPAGARSGRWQCSWSSGESVGAPCGSPWGALGRLGGLPREPHGCSGWCWEQGGKHILEGFQYVLPTRAPGTLRVVFGGLCGLVWGSFGAPWAPLVVPGGAFWWAHGRFGGSLPSRGGPLWRLGGSLGGSLGGLGALGSSLSSPAWPAVHKGDTCTVIIGNFLFRLS